LANAGVARKMAASPGFSSNRSLSLLFLPPPTTCYAFDHEECNIAWGIKTFPNTFKSPIYILMDVPDSLLTRHYNWKFIPFSNICQISFQDNLVPGRSSLSALWRALAIIIAGSWTPLRKSVSKDRRAVYASRFLLTRQISPLSSRTLIPWGGVGDLVRMSFTTPSVSLPERWSSFKTI
jgi:hypothetical protein